MIKIKTPEQIEEMPFPASGIERLPRDVAAAATPSSSQSSHLPIVVALPDDTQFALENHFMLPIQVDGPLVLLK